ncbi:hypothetical protein ACN4EE_12085 [Geminocystis sp. CENA526]|uniref:hypothetical protein n=1 Tax=Geminocystis sp. CENA526 TaxID=1355871 RepID=UPI003D6F8F51
MKSLTVKNYHKLLGLTLALTTSTISLIPFAVSAKPIQEFRHNSSKMALPLNNHTKQNNGPYRPLTPNSTNNNFPTQNQGQLMGLNIGATIPATYTEANKILLTREETMALVLTVTTNVRNNNNQIIIPSGSRILGEFRPDSNGSRFVANTLILDNGNQYPINASSRVITTTETVSAGKNTDAIWQGALAGAGAATIISGVTGDRRITPLEVLGGAGIGAIGGLVFGGDRSQELISIDPRRDLDLTLASSFRPDTTFNNNNTGNVINNRNQGRFW